MNFYYTYTHAHIRIHANTYVYKHTGGAAARHTAGGVQRHYTYTHAHIRIHAHTYVCKRIGGADEHPVPAAGRFGKEISEARAREMLEDFAKQLAGGEMLLFLTHVVCIELWLGC